MAIARCQLVEVSLSALLIHRDARCSQGAFLPGGKVPHNFTEWIGNGFLELAELQERMP